MGSRMSLPGPQLSLGTLYVKWGLIGVLLGRLPGTAQQWAGSMRLLLMTRATLGPGADGAAPPSFRNVPALFKAAKPP